MTMDVYHIYTCTEDSSSCSGKANGEREGIGIKILAESVAFTHMGRRGVGPRDLDP